MGTNRRAALLGAVARPSLGGARQRAGLGLGAAALWLALQRLVAGQLNGAGLGRRGSYGAVCLWL